MAKGKKYQPYREYAEQLNAKELESALTHALALRNFEIELYFKRAAYFWTFVGAAFVAFFVSKTSESSAFLISCLGSIFSFGWYWVNRGNSYWHVSWHIQVQELGRRLFGPLFDPHLKKCRLIETGPYRVSITGINELLSLYVFLVWVFLAVRSVSQIFNFVEPFNGFNCTIIGGITILWTILILKKCVGNKNCHKVELFVPIYKDGDEDQCSGDE
jgi:hypothetical protein